MYMCLACKLNERRIKRFSSDLALFFNSGTISCLKKLEIYTNMCEERRRYESAFENLFEKGKHSSEQLAVFISAVGRIAALQQNTDRVMAFVKANPDKVAIGIGLAVSSWLLYQSIRLGGEIERFFDEIEELKGLFKEYSQFEIPRLEKLYNRAREVTDNYVGLRKQKAYLQEVYDELLKYYDELQKIMNKVDVVIKDVKKGKQDAEINAAISALIAVVSGATAVVSGPAAIFFGGLIAMYASVISTTVSLKNAHGLAKASKELRTLKQDLGRLREHVKIKMVKTMELIDEIQYKEIYFFGKILVVSLVIGFVAIVWAMMNG